MAFTEYAIHSVADLLLRLGEIQENKNWQTRLFFRGHRKVGYKLIPAVRRDFSVEKERDLAREFRARAQTRHAKCPSQDDYPGWLALMQHYGLPTRLLDWSFSPLVALYFATGAHKVHQDAKPESSHGCIWVLNPISLNTNQGWDDHVYPLDARSYSEIIINAFKDEPCEETTGAALAIEIDHRMQLQQGAFTLHGSTVEMTELPKAEDFLIKLTIDPDAKVRLIQQLFQLGITRSYLFPDLDSLSKELIYRMKKT